jgi:CheY-like chemotaxis protein
MEKSLILLVDDNPKNLQVLGSLLKDLYRTAVVGSGHEALEFVTKRVPDLILLNVMMPDMNGFEVCQRLKAIPAASEIPVIFLTARVEIEDVVEGFAIGAVDYVLSKTILPVWLVAQWTSKARG